MALLRCILAIFVTLWDISSNNRMALRGCGLDAVSVVLALSFRTGWINRSIAVHSGSSR